MLAQRRTTGLMLRHLSVAAVPAMASCFILARPAAAFSSSAVASVSWLRNPALAAYSAPIEQLRSPAQLRGMRTSSVLMSAAPPGGDTVVAGMEKKLTNELEPVKLEVIPAYGDPNGSHVTITVVSKKFEGKRALQRQQMVYKVIWEEMQGAVHAVDQMVCKTPEEAGL